MPDVNDLQKYVKADNVNPGDILTFTNSGAILQKDFSKDKNKPDIKSILEIGVRINNNPDIKVYTPNATSLTHLKEEWTSDTDKWVGKRCLVSILEQLSFGKIVKVLVVKPIKDNGNTFDGAAPVVNIEDVKWDE